MGIRETLAENPRPVMIAAGAMIVLCLAWIVWSLRGGSPPDVTSRGTGFYYSDDDGKTFRPGTFEEIATPASGGKEAVRAHVYRFANGEPAISYLEKYTPRGKMLLQQYYQNPDNKGRKPPRNPELESEKLVKKPGSRVWLSPRRDDVGQMFAPPVQGDHVAEWVLP